jgi:hypothetical protein
MNPEEQIKRTEQSVDSFLASQSKVAIIIPLYGYWKDAPTEQLTPEVLQVALTRLNTKKHHAYYIFVGEPERMPKEIWDMVLGKYMGGNAIPVSPPGFSTYAEYVMTGIDTALNETDARFLVLYNPWILIKEDTIDQLLERVNRGDVGIVSGYETKNLIEPAIFDGYKFDLPKEERNLNLDLMGLTRQFAEIMTIDRNYKTHYFLARDFWQEMYAKGFEVISSQFIPIYGFDLDWSLIEEVGDFEADKQYFFNKWHFTPEVQFK